MWIVNSRKANIQSLGPLFSGSSDLGFGCINFRDMFSILLFWY